MKIVSFVLIILFTVVLSAGESAITLVNGKSVKGTITKIEAMKWDGTERQEIKELSVAQGTSEFFVSFDKIDSITLANTDDMSCFEDSNYKPARKYCSRKMIYHIKLKTPGKSKAPVEIIDDRKFVLTFEKGEPVMTAFYKIIFSDLGREATATYKDLEVEVKEVERNSIKNIKM